MLEHILRVAARRAGFTFCSLRSHNHDTTQVPAGEGAQHRRPPHITIYMSYTPDRNDITHEGHVLVEYITINGIKLLKGIPAQGKSMLLRDRKTRELTIL